MSSNLILHPYLMKVFNFLKNRHNHRTLPYVKQEGAEEEDQQREREQKLSEDIREFDVVQKEDVALTSNIALLQVQYNI